MIIKEINRNERVRLVCYLPDREGLNSALQPDNWPAVLICPGGGYYFCCNREGEPIALNLLSKGFVCFVLYYSVGESSRFPNALLDAAWAMKTIRDNCYDFGIDPEKLSVMGFSAGGHLAASISTMYNKDEILESDLSIMPDEVRPNASVLCYPVISGVEDTHLGSFYNLAGTDEPDNDTLVNLSCEYYINEKTPPAFIWHTANDETVPVINSLVYAEALAANNIPFEMHIYEDGPHGLATCDRITNKREYEFKDWLEKCANFLIKTLNIYE